jgi:hypothetical protein
MDFVLQRMSTDTIVNCCKIEELFNIGFQSSVLEDKENFSA